MKRQPIKSRHLFCLALCATACAALAQGPGGGGPGGPGGGGGPRGGGGQGNGPGGGGGNFRPPPVPPVIRALDTNGDGIISADEIDAAPQALQTLEKSGSNQLTIPDLLGPPRHHPPGGQGQGWGPGGGQGGPQTSGSSSSASASPGQNGPGGKPKRPVPPIIKALDTNGDGIIDATEISNAAKSLRTLEKSGGPDQLTVPQLLGPPHHGMRPPGGPGQGGGGPQGGNAQGGPGGGGPGDDQGGPPGPPPGGGDMQPANPPPQGGDNGDNAPPPPPPQQ